MDPMMWAYVIGALVGGGIALGICVVGFYRMFRNIWR